MSAERIRIFIVCLFGIFVATTTYARIIQYKGTIYDENGSALSGIMVKPVYDNKTNTALGMRTNQRGNFKFSAPEGAQQLDLQCDLINNTRCNEFKKGRYPVSDTITMKFNSTGRQNSSSQSSAASASTTPQQQNTQTTTRGASARQNNSGNEASKPPVASRPAATTTPPAPQSDEPKPAPATAPAAEQPGERKVGARQNPTAENKSGTTATAADGDAATADGATPDAQSDASGTDADTADAAGADGATQSGDGTAENADENADDNKDEEKPAEESNADEKKSAQEKEESEKKPTVKKRHTEEEMNKLREDAAAAKEKEQSQENKLLGAAGIAAASSGLMDSMSGQAEADADEEAERNMKNYLATFHCSVGTSGRYQGGEKNIQIQTFPEMPALVAEYRQIAENLKIAKESLDMRPGIESELIIDASTTGLYDDVGIGKTGGAFTSLYRAMTDENSEDAKAWAKQKSDAKSKMKKGLATAAVGVVGGAVGNMLINKDKKADDSKKDDQESEQSDTDANDASAAQQSDQNANAQTNDATQQPDATTESGDTNDANSNSASTTPGVAQRTPVSNTQNVNVNASSQTGNDNSPLQKLMAAQSAPDWAKDIAKESSYAAPQTGKISDTDMQAATKYTQKCIDNGGYAATTESAAPDATKTVHKYYVQCFWAEGISKSESDADKAKARDAVTPLCKKIGFNDEISRNVKFGTTPTNYVCNYSITLQ